MAVRMKIKAGQVLKHPDRSHSYHVDKIHEERNGWHVCVTRLSDNYQMMHFGGAEKLADGSFVTDDWSDGWYVAEEPPGEKSKELSPVPTMMQFFSAVAEGNCPCNIPRSVCEFHKG